MPRTESDDRTVAGPPEETPPATPVRRRSRLLVAAALTTAVLGAGLLGACGRGGGSSSSVSMSCSGDDCRATVSGTPATVQETEVDQRKKAGSSGKKTTTKSTTYETQFRVTAITPGSVQVEGDDGPATVPVGGTFRGDEDVVRVESADGRSAVFAWRD